MRTKPAVTGQLVGVVLSAWLLSACAATPKQVVSAAQQDLACPTAQVAKIDTDRYGASGCGRGAVYMRLCDTSGCRWGRLRHGHEVGVAAQLAPAPTAAPEREVLPAPPPEAREVLPAPAPLEREILPAPPPPNTQSPSAPPDTSAPAPTPTNATPAPVPLSQGDLSEPYDATVPERPTAQQVSYAPPQPLVDDRPPPPAPTYVWVGGYWWWASSGWLWLPGYWCEPMNGYAYNSGYWYWATGNWWYWPGGWSRFGNTTIVVQTAPRPQRIVRVRSFTPRSTVPANGNRVAAAQTPARAVVQAAPVSTFRPQGSPLLRYPTTTRVPTRTNNLGFASQPGVGRVVRPGLAPPRPVQFRASRPNTSAPSSSRPPLSSSPNFRSPTRIAPATRVAPIRSAPPALRPTTIGRPARR